MLRLENRQRCLLQIGLAEVKVGIPYPLAAIEVVRSELSASVARRLVLFGENLSGAEAMAAGILTECAPAGGLLDRAIEKATAATDLPVPPSPNQASATPSGPRPVHAGRGRQVRSAER